MTRDAAVVKRAWRTCARMTGEPPDAVTVTKDTDAPPTVPHVGAIRRAVEADDLRHLEQVGLPIRGRA